MSGGMEIDPAVVREFAEVFNQAATQVGHIQTSVGATSAKAADFGTSWAEEHGANFEKYMADLAADLGNLSKHLGEIGAQLNQTTDIAVQADSSGYANIKAIEVDMESGGDK